MKDFKVKILDEEYHFLIKTLKNVGMSGNVATTMAYLMNVDESSAREIEISTGLRQPEVSLAIRFMTYIPQMSFNLIILVLIYKYREFSILF